MKNHLGHLWMDSHFWRRPKKKSWKAWKGYAHELEYYTLQLKAELELLRGNPILSAKLTQALKDQGQSPHLDCEDV